MQKNGKANRVNEEARKSGSHHKNMQIPGVTFILPVSIDSSWVIKVADKACSIKCGDSLTQDDSKTKIENVGYEVPIRIENDVQFSTRSRLERNKEHFSRKDAREVGR